ncbi:hypothetical protein G3N57_19170 [Paraburkholderia sp. Se-20369]|nr:hypothetical protein [Paraburkholderia sp. Se-20369]TCW87403.1 hypothetical protein C5O80_05695 [Burkholderia sp. SRS-46]
MPMALFIYLVLCLMVAFLGRKSRVGFVRTLLLSFLLTPLTMLIYLLLFASINDEGNSPVRDRSTGR